MKRKLNKHVRKHLKAYDKIIIDGLIAEGVKKMCEEGELRMTIPNEFQELGNINFEPITPFPPKEGKQWLPEDKDHPTGPEIHYLTTDEIRKRYPNKRIPS